MFIGVEVTPGRLGVQWGASQTECLATLNENAVVHKQSARWIALDVNGSDVTLEFSEQDALFAIRVLIDKSDDFYEAEEGALEQASEVYYQRYQYLQKECLFTLGTPVYSGRWNDIGFPADCIAIEVSYWELLQGRLQIEYDHSDKELPIFVWMVWYRPMNYK